MKKLTAFSLFVVLAFFAAGQTNSGDLAVPKFENQTFDFGKIKQGQPVSHEFKFTNTGKVPMIITNVTASCGCTTPDWTKDIIPPGGAGFVKATYNAASPGAFNKSVTVTANVETGYFQLFVKGEVVTPAQK
jgi:hypothetical protein